MPFLIAGPASKSTDCGAAYPAPTRSENHPGSAISFDAFLMHPPAAKPGAESPRLLGALARRRELMHESLGAVHIEPTASMLVGATLGGSAPEALALTAGPWRPPRSCRAIS